MVELLGNMIAKCVFNNGIKPLGAHSWATFGISECLFYCLFLRWEIK